MNKSLCLTFRFLDPEPRFHGRGDDGPEWPPSPLRMFQALVCAAGTRSQDDQFWMEAQSALRWLETIQPTILSPENADLSFGFRMYVPNNSGDLMTAAWARGDTDVSMAKFRVEKDVRPTILMSDSIRFLFSLPEAKCPHFDTLQAIARSVTHLGWGIDMVAGNAELLTEAEVTALEGEVWKPVLDSYGTALRVCKSGTLEALVSKHQAFLERISPQGFSPVPPLSAFGVVNYRPVKEPSPRPFAAFSLLKPDASNTASFGPLRGTRDVAGMVRHATATAAQQQGWTEEQINVFVHGKTPDGSKPPNGQLSPDRFQYLPLPTINYYQKRVESIRRVIVTAPPQCSKQVEWVRRAIAGAELVNHADVAALLTILPTSDWVLGKYVNPSTTWSTVTPVILPGFDDPDGLRRKLKKGQDAETQQRYLARLEARTDELLRKSFEQAGYSREFVAQIELNWRNVGFHRGTELASRYLPPENLQQSPRVHVQVRFPSAVRGPISVGSGRFRGFGVFARMDG